MASLYQRYRDYFFEFSIQRFKLDVFRFCFFVLIGIDGLLQLPHAARYGAGEFNVGHLPWLQPLLPEPSRAILVTVFFLQTYLGFRIALGAAARSAVWGLTALYGYAYFVSQLDSYQHHYLVFLLLLLCCFVPWERPSNADASSESADVATSWALRLILVQLSIVYFWAAVTKCESVWLDGTLLGMQLSAGDMRDMGEWIGLGMSAKLVLATEFALAFALLYRRIWPLAVVLGFGLHASIEFGAELQIGIFSYYMFALYLLLVPDRVFDGVRRMGRGAFDRGARALNAVAAIAPAFWVISLIAIVGGVLVLYTIPVPQMTVIAWVATLLACAAGAWQLVRRADGKRARARALGVMLAHGLACASIALLPTTMDSVGDYYKFWGGSSRRLGNWDDAESAYRHLVEIRPKWGPGHYHLARIDNRSGRREQALAGFIRAQKAAPNDPRAYVEAAVIHSEAGRGDKALSTALVAVALLEGGAPSSSTATQLRRMREIINRWSGRRR